MDRRQWLAGAASVSASAGLAAAAPRGARPGRVARAVRAKHAFQLNYAPHLGMFRHLAGEDPIAQLEFMADQGFTAFEDNGMRHRPVELQERMRATMERLGMTMGVFVANTNGFGQPSFASGDEGMREQFLKDVSESLEIAKRVNARWCTVVMGDYEHRLELDYQTVNAVESLRRAAEICEPAGLVMVIEPLNPWRDHPNMFLSRIPQAFQICRAVDSPSCKILFDIYHQQITEGNLIPNIDRAWDEIAYFQIGDNPGRNEPGTGEIHYRNVFRHIHAKGYTGVLGMEHGNSRPDAAGEQAVIDAYVDADGF